MDTMRGELEKQTIQKLNKKDPTNKDLADVLKFIIEKMWSEERLAEHIKNVHSAMCAKCPRCSGTVDKVLKWGGWVILALVAIIVKLTGANIPALVK